MREDIKKPLIAGGVIVLILTAFYGIYWWQSQPEEEKFVRVSGQIVSLEGVPVAGVDLVAGDTRVRTTDSGQFSFGRVSSFDGIALTHPNLLRALQLLPEAREESENMTVYFDEMLINTLITVVDREARRRPDLVYEHLLPEVKTQVSLESFDSDYEFIYSEADIVDQTIVIADIERLETYEMKIERELWQFESVYAFTLKKGDATKTYHFVAREVAVVGRDDEQTDTLEKRWFLLP